MKTILVIILSYLFGSIPWGLVIGKVFFHKDIRKEGSGNIGGTNAGRVLGKPIGMLVIILDALKGFFAMLLAYKLANNAIIFAGLACCIGHCFPIFTKFHGGKAVATTYGFLLGIAILMNGQYFWQFFFPIICFLIILYFTKMVSVASISSILIASITSYIINPNKMIPLAIFILWILITYRHKSNIERIKNGTESKIKWM